MDEEEFINKYLQPYFRHGHRESLATVLQIWSPEIDKCNIIGDAMHQAIYHRDLIAIQMILDAGVDATIRDSQHPNNPPLLNAAEVGFFDACRLLWQVVGPEGRVYPAKNHHAAATCLSIAAENGHMDLVVFFLNVWDGWSSSETTRALTDAVRKWQEDVVDLLLARVPYTADALQEALQESIHYRVRWVFGRRGTNEQYLQQYRIVCRLIDAGANPNELHNGKSVLLSAVRHVQMHQCVHKVGAVRALLESGAEPNAQDRNGETALHILLRNPGSSIPALRLLLEHGASPEMGNQDDETPLHLVAYAGDLERLQLCLQHCRDPDSALRLRTRASHGESLLHYAAAGGTDDIVDFLLSNGMDVNSTNGNDWTPLLCALMPTDNKWPSGACRLARLLIERGADVKVVSDEGWSPLHALASQVLNLDPPRSLEWEREEDIVPLARELIARGASLEAQAAVLDDGSAIVTELIGKWGSRMGKFSNGVAKNANSKTLPNAEPDTTPLMWAYRVGAMMIFDVIREHWAATESVEERDNQS
ncbi:ankyrin repeat protein [Podospora aff. communis PSN243]|uniref:Ankyrin repeat protein n=1 Tax=Podospora aff. communis PSN243 TaxID=3040156 RepID=A0AAV9H4W9_9PEZI|nr:ankyrin repeat protein [Podospora aff. communis PSN243]